MSKYFEVVLIPSECKMGNQLCSYGIYKAESAAKVLADFKAPEDALAGFKLVAIELNPISTVAHDGTKVEVIPLCNHAFISA